MSKLADRVLVMKDGWIVEGGDTRTVLVGAGHPYARQLISAATGKPRGTTAEPGDVVAEATALREALPRGAGPSPYLERVGLGTDVLDRYPRQLSGGRRQRVAVARAIAPRPSLINCDEPVSALDVSVQAQVLDLLAGIRETDGTALLFISHDLGVIRDIADRVLVMHDGRVVEQGPVKAVFDHAGHQYTRALLDAVPTLEVSR